LVRSYAIVTAAIRWLCGVSWVRCGSQFSGTARNHRVGRVGGNSCWRTLMCLVLRIRLTQTWAASGCCACMTGAALLSAGLGPAPHFIRRFGLTVLLMGRLVYGVGMGISMHGA
jgi:hypothetical protein